MKTGIVIPAHNEERRIGRTLEEYELFFEALRKEGKTDYEILVSINNSKDSTKKIVEGFRRRNKRITYIDLAKGGKGYAVIEGFKKLIVEKFDNIGFVDADMATSPQEYWKIVQKTEYADLVIADRYLKESKVYPPNTFRRIFVARIFNSLVRAMLLIPYRDTQCGAKVFKKESLAKVLPKISMSKWAFDVDLIYTSRKIGLKVIASPTIWKDKEYSKINFMKAAPWMLLGVIRLRIINSPAKKMIRVYDKFFKFIWKLGAA